jgi:hypothetical protein
MPCIVWDMYLFHSQNHNHHHSYHNNHCYFHHHCHITDGSG